MVLSLLLVKLIVPISSLSRFMNLPIIIIYTLVGGAVYLFYMYKTNSVEQVFGDKIINKFKKKKASK